MGVSHSVKTPNPSPGDSAKWAAVPLSVSPSPTPLVPADSSTPVTPTCLMPTERCSMNSSHCNSSTTILHDSEVFDALRLPTEPFLDTMVRAYNLCLGGGGDDEDEGESRAGRGSLSLKVLAYRHCNMHMTSFKDTVYPHSLPHVLTWLKRGGRYLHRIVTDRRGVSVGVCRNGTNREGRRGIKLDRA